MKMTSMVLSTAIMAASLLSGCSDGHNIPKWVAGAKQDIEHDVRWDTDGAADCKPVALNEQWFVMCYSQDKFAGIAFMVTESNNSRGFIAQPVTGKSAQIATSFRSSPVLDNSATADIDKLKAVYNEMYN